MARRKTDTQGAEDSLAGAQAPDQAEAPITAATGEADKADPAEGTEAPAATSAGGTTPPADPSFAPVRAATAASPIHHDGEHFRAGDLVPLTQVAFAALSATGALVEADWEDCADL